MKKIEEGTSFSFIAIDQEEVVGHVLVHLQEDILLNEVSIFLEDVVVKKERRREGIGKMLIEEVIRFAKEHKIEKIELTSNESRLAAHALYKKCGFTIRETTVFTKKIK